LVEVAISWFRNPRDYREKISISGLENLEKSVNEGHGVLLLCAHFSTLELGGTLLSLFHSLDVTYRKHTNPVFQYVMTKARNRHFSSVIEREDVRGAVNSLKKGRTLWFAPDQDYGAKHSIFVPFFGVKAATLTATSRFAKMGGAKVLFFSHYRKDDNSGYQLTISPALSNFPSTDLRKDAIRINKLIEDAVMKHPDQYIWLHKRFKTQPIGNPSVYQ
jgi:KDO2-lipid IV(A) lauroyltransferase